MDNLPVMTVYEAIFARRDVRNEFTGEPILDQVLHRILSAAHAAPSVGLSQPWDFIVVRDQSARRRFRDQVLDEREVFAEYLAEATAECFAGIKIEGILESS